MIPKMMASRQNQNISRKIPSYIHQRRKLYKALCPNVDMMYTYRNVADGSITKINTTTAPVATYETDRNYEKLYEEAHVQVCIIIFN